MGEHHDKLFYCSCRCGCTTVIASELLKGCTFCSTFHKKMNNDNQWMPERKEIHLE